MNKELNGYVVTPFEEKQKNEVRQIYLCLITLSTVEGYEKAATSKESLERLFPFLIDENIRTLQTPPWTGMNPPGYTGHHYDYHETVEILENLITDARLADTTNKAAWQVNCNGSDDGLAGALDECLQLVLTAKIARDALVKSDAMQKVKKFFYHFKDGISENVDILDEEYDFSKETLTITLKRKENEDE